MQRPAWSALGNTTMPAPSSNTQRFPAAEFFHESQFSWSKSPSVRVRHRYTLVQARFLPSLVDCNSHSELLCHDNSFICGFAACADEVIPMVLRVKGGKATSTLAPPSVIDRPAIERTAGGGLSEWQFRDPFCTLSCLF
jgi:hypothetical protein